MALPKRQNSLMYSSEFIFRDIIRLYAQPNFCEIAAKLRASLASNGWTRVSVLLFVRDPIERLISQWQQSLKAGDFKDFENWCAAHHFKKGAPNVGLFLDVAQALEFDVAIRNYSRHKRSLLAPVAEWLDVRSHDLVVPPTKSVNRSLTRSEAKLLIEVNRNTKSPTKALGFELVDEAHNVSSAKNLVNPEVLDRIATAFTPSIAELNQRLPKDERYMLGVPSEYKLLPDTSDYQFNAAQLEVIAKHIARLSDGWGQTARKRKPSLGKRLRSILLQTKQ